jgi:hypothetical protein
MRARANVASPSSTAFAMARWAVVVVAVGARSALPSRREYRRETRPRMSIVS